MNRKLTWQEHFDLVREYVGQYLNSADIRSLIPGKVEFYIDDLDDTPNAYVYATSRQNYRIVFNGGLIKTLTREARLIVEGSPLIFREVDRSNEDLVEKCHIWLLFIWIDFIFSHEWAHAYYGHLKLVAGEAKWYELKSHEEVETSPLTHYQLQRIEAHVDRAAGVNLLGHFARYYSEVSETIYGK